MEIIPSSTSNCPEDYTYTLQTYEGTVQDAQAEGLYVTHSNPCGVCSSLQDLSVYMEQGPQLRKSASDCGIAGILGEAAGCWNKVLSKLGIYRQLRNNVVL